MIAAFLLPFPFRGHPAPYLWVYYRLLTSFSEPLLFITGRDYLRVPAEWAALGRWEMQEGSSLRLGFAVPSVECMAHQAYRFLPESLFEWLLIESGGNPVAAFRRLLTENIPVLESAFDKVLADSKNIGLEGILTWCNCPSLSSVARKHGIPVLHLEMGPLRWPEYRPTAYLDFSGVNGNTEAAERFRADEWQMTGIDMARLRAFFAPAHEGGISLPPEYDVGVPLQVEDDSNLVAFGHGFDNQSLLAHTQLACPQGRVLVRGHPGSLFRVRPDWYAVDDSSGSVPFIRCCRRISTINSSVGLEAMLLEIPVIVLGDCSYRFIGETDDREEFIRRLAFYLFAYLVPMDLIFSPTYLRFRLAHPTELSIVTRHLEAYGISTGNASSCGAQVLAALGVSS